MNKTNDAYGEDVTLGSPGQPGEPASLGDLPLVVLSAGATYDGIPDAVVTATGGGQMYSPRSSRSTRNFNKSWLACPPRESRSSPRKAVTISNGISPIW
jgi:hypothetical protein